MSYWNEETPAVADTGKNILRLFRKAGRLQVSLPCWTDDKGQERAGKTVTVDLDALSETPEALALLQSIMEELES